MAPSSGQVRSRNARVRTVGAAALLTVFGAAGCEQAERVQDHFRDRTPYEAYADGLAKAGLLQTALGKDWLQASLRAVDQALEVSLPFQEEGFIAADKPTATAYRIHVGRGQRLTTQITLASDEGTRVFIDLFRMPENPEDPLRPVLSMDSVPGDFQYEPWRGGDFILRVQPELLRGGRYRVVMRLDAQLAFPVEGYDERAIQSGFGVARDAGRRRHEGVDIFARRGTPVRAVSAGVVSRVQITPLGGKVVWERDRARNASIYYAHLDSQVARPGQQVQVGDLLGFVGNTGNARTTPPHLHFGVYRRGEGAVDPAPFIRRPRGELAALTADLGRLGSWVRLRDEGIRLRSSPTLRAPVIRDLETHNAVRVLGASGSWYRVALPDGGSGYVAARLTEPADVPFETRVASAPELLRSGPDDASPLVAEIEEGTEMPVLGTFDRYLLVRARDGSSGWLGVDGTRP
jgi:murein DD-endopeptidase MepM/ murein hydrolase activator NlpD